MWALVSELPLDSATKIGLEMRADAEPKGPKGPKVRVVNDGDAKVYSLADFVRAHPENRG